MDFKIIVGFCVVLLYCSLAVDSKAVAKTDAKKHKENKEAETDVKDSASGSDDDTQIDCDPEKLKKCNIICEKSKTVEKRTCNCKEEQSMVECAQKRRNCEGKKKCQKCHGHGVEKRCKSAQGKKKSCGCASLKKQSPLMQRVFRFPALMITPIKSYNGDEKGQIKKGSKRCGCDCCHHCCCCEPCCCCCCEPCCCCHECCCCPCCCDCCHHCCHCCHCCPCCCCGCGCKKSKNAAAPVPAVAPAAAPVAKSH